jgi:hypothetical protein
MKSFEFESSKVIELSEVLISMLNNENIVPYIAFNNISYVVVPRGARFFEYFKGLVFGGSEPPKRRKFLTIKDFNIHNIVKVQRARICFFSQYKKVVNVELHMEVGRFSEPMGSIGRRSISSIFEDYRSLVESLPVNVKTRELYNILGSSYEVITTSAVTLTFLYTLFNLDKGIRIDGGRYQKEAVEYVNHLVGILKRFGNDFYEAIKGLKALVTML